MWNTENNLVHITRATTIKKQTLELYLDVKKKTNKTPNQVWTFIAPTSFKWTDLTFRQRVIEVY